MKILRTLRIVFALAFFLLISWQFVDIYHTLPKLYYRYPPASLQFVPSVLKLCGGVAIASAWVCVIFAGLTLIFGRTYCSFICPFGILMDVLRKIAKFPAENKFLKKTKLGKFSSSYFLNLKYSKPVNFLRILFLAIAILSIAFGWGAILGLIDPYSLWGKIMGVVFGVSSDATIYASGLFAEYGYYGVKPVPEPTITLAYFGFAFFGEKGNYV